MRTKIPLRELHRVTLVPTGEIAVRLHRELEALSLRQLQAGNSGHSTDASLGLGPLDPVHSNFPFRSRGGHFTTTIGLATRFGPVSCDRQSRSF